MSVYFVRNTATGAVKIGWSKDPPARLADLQCACDGRLTIEAIAETRNRHAERLIHQGLAHERIHGEWFKGPETDALVQGLKTGDGEDARAYFRLVAARWPAFAKIMADAPSVGVDGTAARLEAIGIGGTDA